MTKPKKPNLRMSEFVLMLAFMVSIVAMSTDIMLPALALIGADLGVENINDTQLIVSSLFAGFALGQLLAGPLSDSYGRRPVILGGYFVFAIGCILSVIASDFAVMIFGRVLQGVGAAAPRIVSMSLIRDGYEGRAMAKIMSIIMSVFILVPALAPSLGQMIIVLFPWEATFVTLLGMAVIAALWFGIRQPETLTIEKRRPFTVKSILSGCRDFFGMRVVIGYTIASGFIFGAFMAYLGTSRQIFQDVMGVGDMFALYFGLAALSIGAASLLNSILVMKLGMRKLTHISLIALLVLSGSFTLIFWLQGGLPSLPLFLIWLLSTFFCVGIQFGNLTALAMEPLGKIAGLGAALSGSISTFVSLPFGWMLGQLFDGTVLPLVLGFFVLGGCALLSSYWADRS